MADRKNYPFPCFQATGTIFKLVQDIIRTNIFTKGHEDLTINVTFIGFTSFYYMYSHIWKYSPPPSGNTNLLSKFHEDRTINMASKVLTRFYYSHINTCVKGKIPRPLTYRYVLTRFHEYQTKNLASRVLTRQNAPPHSTGAIFELGKLPHPWRQCFLTDQNHFELVQDIIGTNLMTKFHEYRPINVASGDKCRAPWWPCFSQTRPIFEFIQNVMGTFVLTKFHEDRTINFASRVLTRINLLTNMLTRKNAPPPDGHVFQQTKTIFKLFNEDGSRNFASGELTRKNAPPPYDHVFQPTKTILELVHDVIGTNLLNKFHEDRTINVASRVLTRKNALTPGGHFHEDLTINVAYRQYKLKCLAQWRPYIIEKNLLPKFHEDRTINVACRVLTRHMLTPHDARRTKGDHKSSPCAHCAQLSLKGN
ncbi:hypothetical protein DPMN_074734 [Dreissena polymorpha]|uniref:Uncharacterized protein n=1 Tax=Dreissena polymorpha TaxID=45954 RepID=A0A9D3YGT9_DREPO|nr:hypothetical protein DPMN_074734 [Dreissena polymorpha]